MTVGIRTGLSNFAHVKVGVITFPGSNCDHDMEYALGTELGFQVERLWHKDRDLKGVDLVVLPGGFSYGDYLRSGAIARFSPIMEEVMAHAKRGGRVLGVCNGFQILCEAGLLPGALRHNEGRKFICRNVLLRAESLMAPMTASLPDGQPLCIPIAHGEGCYYADPQTLADLETHQQVLFRYCDSQGTVNAAANPNGSLNNIAGICNRQGNVLGMMPHPERACSEALGNTDGRAMLEALASAVEAS